MASLTTSGLAIVQHVPELQVDYRNLLKTIYSEPTEAKNKLGCKIWTLFKNCNCATGQELSEQIKDKLGLFCSKFYALEIIASTVLDSTNHSKFGIGGKELNLMVSLTTSVVESFGSCGTCYYYILYLISKYIKILHNFHYCMDEN
ncbi:uncharacterized protein LOC112017216 isoform X3 [Quercus suber]|uniref:uncharacterized protein LOC112017216 isoform X3 n=1 Tax=Quercus suber TaxID=58331 RepID=UPI0032DE91C2